MPRNKQEYQLQKAVCKYMAMQYPTVLFNSDLSGISLTVGQAKQIKSLRSNRGFPDIAIYHRNKYFNGLFIELKKEGTKIYTQKGELYKDEHLREQAKTMVQLRSQGFQAVFCVGFDKAKKDIDLYMYNENKNG